MSPRPCLLVIDDDQSVLSLLAHLATRDGYDVLTASHVHDALRRVRERHVDLALLDLRMPGVSGFETLALLRRTSPRTVVVLMTGFGTIENAVQAVKLGAGDYLTKPFDLERVRELLRQRRDASDVPSGTPPGEPDGFHGMVGRGRSMRGVCELLTRLAPHARTTLVTGETGTGKELAARALHALGPRSQQRLVTVNCSAVVETLFESELFGHARGAFTGATDHKAGLFETADGGTLFLDEVGELPPGAQAKLLRVLENGEVQRVGSLQARRVDVCVVAATNRDLRAEVLAGRFRRDLYYRLDVVRVHMPALRERREDIPALAQTFVQAFAARTGRPLSGVSAAGARMLMDAAWHGNVRQLRNVIERACILAEGRVLDEGDLRGSLEQAEGTHVTPAAASAVVVPMARQESTTLDEVEREHIVRTLERVHGNKALAARLLGISRRAFYRQLERHRLHRRVPGGVGGSRGGAPAPAPALEQAS